jgi:multiple sugar transport system substrate-binding protein
MQKNMESLNPKLNRRQLLKLMGASGATLALSPLLTRVAYPGQPTPLWFNTLFHGGDAEAMQIIVKTFNAMHKDIQLDLTQGSWTEYYSQLYNAVIAGEAPQLGICHNFRFSKMYPALTALNDSPAGNLLTQTGLKRDDYIEYVWDIADIDGKQYGIPLDNALLGIYYNKALFRKSGLDPETPPDNLDAFENAANAIRDKTGKYAYHPGAYGQPRWYRRHWYILLWQKGGQLIDHDSAAFNNEKGLDALQYLVDIPKKGWNKPGTNGAAQFQTGELGMLINGTWHYLSLAKTDLDWGFLGIPKWFEKRYTWGSNHFLVIPKQPQKNHNLVLPAARSIKWLSENSYLWGMLGGHVPMNKQALKSSELLESKTWEKTLRRFSQMSFEGVYRSLPLHPKIVEINAAIQPNIDEAYNGTVTPKEALDKSEKAVNKVLKS